MIKLGEKELGNSENLFKAIYDDSPIGIELYNSNGKLIDINQACMELFGVSSKDDVKGFDLLNDPNIPQDHLTKLKQRETVRYESVFNFDLVKKHNLYKTKKAGKIYIDVLISPLFLGGNKYISNYLVHIQDISYRKIVEHKLIDLNEELEKKIQEKIIKLNKSERNYQLLAENLNDIVTVVNYQGQVEYINQEAPKKLMGYSDKDIMYKNVFELIHPEDKEKALKEFQNTFNRGEGFVEARISNKDNQYLWTETNGKSFIDNDGNKKILTITRDVTERKKAELKAQKEKKRTELYLNLVNVVIIALDRNGNISLINKKGMDILGWKDGELDGKNWFENCLPPKDRGRVQKYFKKLMKGEIDVISFYENPVITKNGDEKLITWSTILIKDSDENITGVLSSGEDITERMEAEKELKKIDDRLKILASSGPAFIYTAKPYGDFGATFISENVKGLTGFEPEEFTNNTEIWINNVHPEDKDLVLSRLSNISHEKSLGYEYRFKFKDGIYHWMRDESKLIVDDKGAPVELIGSWSDITWSKKSEERLQYQAKLVENVSDAIISTDLNFKIITWNKAAESIYGWKAEEIIGKKAMETITIEYPYDDPNSVVKQIFEEGFWKGEVIQPRKDATRLNMLASISLIKDITGTPIGVVSINHDITDIKKAEKKIRDSEVRYRDLFENSPVALMEQDFSELKLHVEKLQASGIKDFEKYFENNPEELLKCMYMVKVVDVNRKTLDIYEANGKEYFLSRMNQPTEGLKYMTQDALLDNKREILSLIRGETMYESELTSKTSKGETAHLYAKTSIIPGFEDTWQKIILSIVDITNLKRTQEKLRESEQKFRTIAEQSVLGVVIQQDGFIKFANAAVAEIIEYPLHVISDWTVEDTYRIIHKDDIGLITAKFKERQEGNFRSVSQYESRIITKSGKLKWVDIYTKPIIYKGRNAVLSTFMDITVKKQVEEELKEVSRLKSELLSRTSHELKTPLVSIKGYADLLLTQHYEDLDFYTVSILHEIKQGCSRLESLIKDLLESSKLESGEIKLNKIEDDLAFLIRFCVRDLKGLVEIRKHNLIIDIKEEMIIHFEKERIYEVIVNLLSNAIKYTPPNGKIIIRSEVQKGNYVISVQDTGIGLTKEEKEKIFKKFGKIERYGQGLDVVSEGSGLGLYISKKIIELHGGNIWVKSKGRKKGSTFYFSLPINPN